MTRATTCSTRTKALYQNYEVDVSPYWLGSNFSFAQFLGQTAYYKNLHQTGIIWANSLRIGLEQPFNGSEVPLSSAFFAGGGSTLARFSAGRRRPAARDSRLRQSRRSGDLHARSPFPAAATNY